MPKNSWLIFARRTNALEKTFQPKLIRLIKQFRADFINDLTTQGESAAKSNLSQRILPEDLTALIQSIYKTAGLMGAKMTAGEIKQFAKQEQKAAGFGRNEQWIRDVINYLKLHMLSLVQNITDTMRDDILNILQKGIDGQLSLPEIVKNLQSTGLIQARARVIARTEIVRAANVGHSVAAKSFPYEVNKKWSAAKDHRTRHSHVLTNGHMVDENDFFKVPLYEGKVQIGFDEMLYPGDANAHPSNTVNCFLPDELTSVNPKIVKRAFRNRYDGKIVTIQTSSGKKFTCTPNHPILTTAGWVAAGNLTNAHDLVKSSFIDTHALPEFNVQNSPSTFKQMFDAFGKEGVTMRMSRVVVNFYGDLPASDVDIISVNSELGDRIQPSFLQVPDKRFFKYSNFRKVFLFANSLFNSISMMKVFRQFSNRVIGFCNQLLFICITRLSHTNIHRFASASNINSIFGKADINAISGNSISFSELLNAYSAFVFSNDLINRNIFSVAPHIDTDARKFLVDESGAKVHLFGDLFARQSRFVKPGEFFLINSNFPTSNFDAVAFKNDANVFTCTADNVTDLISVHAGVVETDNIIDVKFGFHNGDVYTFETVNQMYDINGYVARNCRCRVIYEPKRDSAGNLILRNQNIAPVIPMRNQSTTYTNEQIAAILKSNIYVGVEK